MIVTKEQLREVIREEIQKLNESGWRRWTKGPWANKEAYHHPDHEGLVVKDGSKWKHTIPNRSSVSFRDSHSTPFSSKEDAMKHAERRTRVNARRNAAASAKRDTLRK